jgi:hypothetical protein
MGFSNLLQAKWANRGFVFYKPYQLLAALKAQV